MTVLVFIFQGVATIVAKKDLKRRNLLMLRKRFELGGEDYVRPISIPLAHYILDSKRRIVYDQKNGGIC